MAQTTSRSGSPNVYPRVHPLHAELGSALVGAPIPKQYRIIASLYPTQLLAMNPTRDANPLKPRWCRAPSTSSRADQISVRLPLGFQLRQAVDPASKYCFASSIPETSKPYQSRKARRRTGRGFHVQKMVKPSLIPDRAALIVSLRALQKCSQRGADPRGPLRRVIQP